MDFKILLQTSICCPIMQGQIQDNGTSGPPKYSDNDESMTFQTVPPTTLFLFHFFEIVKIFRILVQGNDILA